MQLASFDLWRFHVTRSRKAGDRLLRQLQEAGAGTLRVSNTDPLLAETRYLRFTIEDERTLAIHHKFREDEPLTLPLGEDGAFVAYTFHLLLAIWYLHLDHSAVSLHELHRLATAYLASGANEMVVFRIVIVEI